jgi:hypothetical protein
MVIRKIARLVEIIAVKAHDEGTITVSGDVAHFRVAGADRALSPTTQRLERVLVLFVPAQLVSTPTSNSTCALNNAAGLLKVSAP